jgi:hypothetical protein
MTVAVGAASLTLTPQSGGQPQAVGEKLLIEGQDFKASTVVAVTLMEIGVTYSIASDAGGYFSSDAWAAKAGAKLTVTGNAVAAETVTIGAVTYTWRASVTTTANEVLVGADAATSLANLKAAINLDTSLGAVYGSATVVHPTVHAGELTATTLTLQAKTGGTGGNSLASTETMTVGSFGGATFASGAAAGTTNPFVYMPESTRPITVSANDSNGNTATARQTVVSE